MFVLSSGRTDESHVLLLLFSQNESMLFRVPTHVGATECRGPFQLEIAMKNNLYVDRFGGVDVDQDDGTGLVDRDEEGFTNREGVAGIEDGAGFRAHRERTSQRLRRNLAVAHMEAQMEIAQDLQRINPRLEASRFIPQQAGALAGVGKKFPRTDGTRKLERATEISLR